MRIELLFTLEPLNEIERDIPLLSKAFQGGVAARSRKYRAATFERADGVVAKFEKIRTYQPPRPLPSKVASRHFLEGRGHPSLERRGIFRADSFTVSQTAPTASTFTTVGALYQRPRFSFC